MKMVRGVFPELPKVFTVDDVEEALRIVERGMPRDKISQVLSKMGRSKEIIVVEQGVGRRASRYGLFDLTDDF